MASPHAVGVAALIVAEYGKRDRRNGGLTMDPADVERILKRHGDRHAVPAPAAFRPTLARRRPRRNYTATCEGTPRFNGFYGEGIVDALGAVSGRR